MYGHKHTANDLAKIYKNVGNNMTKLIFTPLSRIFDCTIVRRLPYIDAICVEAVRKSIQ